MYSFLYAIWCYSLLYSGEEDLSTALHNNIRVLPTADRLAAHHISKDAPTSDAVSGETVFFPYSFFFFFFFFF